MKQDKYFYSEEEAFFCKRLNPKDEMGEEMTESDVVEKLNTLQFKLDGMTKQRNAEFKKWIDTKKEMVILKKAVRDAAKEIDTPLLSPVNSSWDTQRCIYNALNILRQHGLLEDEKK